MKLDGVITEFADVYAPIAQFYRGLNKTDLTLDNNIFESDEE